MTVEATLLTTFLSTPSARRAMYQCGNSRYNRNISIHVLREEGDRSLSKCPCGLCYFYPRPPRGGRRFSCSRSIHISAFLSTPSARRATHLQAPNAVRCQISIHALRKEGDLKCPIGVIWTPYFYPRPPRGGRPCRPRTRGLPIGNFYPRPPQGGRLSEQKSSGWKLKHFYPRPPRGGRQCPVLCKASKNPNFYPRPPRGGRLNISAANPIYFFISIHALREEGDERKPAQ